MWNFKVKSGFVSFLAFILLVFTTSVAQAQLPASSSWTSTGPGSPTVVSTAYGVDFSYNYNNTSVYNGQSWQFSTVAAATEDIAYNWQYSGLHAWFQASAKVSVFVVHNGTTNTTVLYDSTVSGNFNAAGASTLHLTAGDTYGYIIYGKNYDSNSFLIGTLEISKAPVIYQTAAGTIQSGWYKSDVVMDWTVRDGLSQGFTTSGCAPLTMINDSTVTGTTYTCTVTSPTGIVSKSLVIKRDTTAPSTLDNAPTGGANTEATVQLTASDGGSGVAATHYKINNGATQTGTSVHIASNGIYTLSYWSVDNAGNTESPKTATIMINNAIFQADIVSPTNHDVTVTVSFPGDAQTKEVKTDNLNWIPYTAPIVVSENKTIHARYYIEGNPIESSYVISNIDKIAPITTADEGTIDPATKYVTVNLTAADNVSGIADTYYTVDNGEQHTGNSIELRTQGIHQIKYWSMDSLGNLEIQKSINVQVQLLPIPSNGVFRIDDVMRLINPDLPERIDLNDDGQFTNLDIAIMLHEITPVSLTE